MNNKVYHKTNFFKHTFCIFREVAADVIKEKNIHYNSKSGSSYSFTDEGVYRFSNHWGRAANCRWRLLPLTDAKTNNSGIRIGYAKWTDFYPNNDVENLFYIEINDITGEATFQHKSNPGYDGKAIIRNASETTKRIQQIKKLLDDNSWMKYLASDNLEKMRNEIIFELITTNKTLQQIKQKFLV